MPFVRAASRSLLATTLCLTASLVASWAAAGTEQANALQPAASAGQAAADAAVRGAAGSAAPTAGREAYLRHCARCHQAGGEGVPNLYPSLRAAAAEWQDPAEPIRAVLAGRRGEIQADGGRFHSVMPTHGFLGNEIVAETLDYVVAEWGEDGPRISTEDVAAVRRELVARHPASPDRAPGPSPLAELEGVEYVTTDGPPISVADFERARRLYYGNCTGCHGVLREGTAGNPLTPELMRKRGTEYLRSVIGYGSSTGMPAWGTSETLSAEEIQHLATFLQHPVPQPPDMDEYQIRDSWHQHRIPSERPDSPRHDYDLDRMFVAALHDVGELALIDGVSKRVIAQVPVCQAPHRVTASASGRYLYVICREGTVSLVDLYAAPPERVASVRIGYEARALGASRHPGYEDAFALAGAYWPPQLVLLDGRTLEPLKVVSTRSYAARTGRYHPEPRVTDIAGSPAHPEFISQIKETGHVYLFPYGGDGAAELRDLEAVPELRAGSFSSDGRYYLTPTDSNAVSVLDVERQALAATIPARVFGGNPGTSYRHPELGPVWVTSTMVGDELVVIGTDPAGHPHRAWQVVQRVPGPASGSLFVATHPASRHLWMDTPLTADNELSRSVAVFRKDDLEAGYRTLPVAQWSGLKEGPRRVLQPAYSPDGSEVWLAVWNPQDLGSAIVVVDDASLEPVTAIRTPELITPTRIYSVAALRRAAATPEPAAAPPADTTAPAAPASTPADPAADQDAVTERVGAELYLDNCANCHGVYGEGDGPMAPYLPTALKDLRYLSARNGGEFPAAFVRAVIDGREMRAAHGPEGMPVWGAEFARGEGPEAAARAEAKITALVEFLEEIQLPAQR